MIPVLVGGAGMPRADTLPEAIRPLARRNAVGLRPERFRADCQGLVTALKESLAAAEQERAARTEAERKAAEAARLEAEAQAAARVKAAEERGRAQAAAGLSAEDIRKAEELASWDFVKDRNDIQDLRDHLARFPGGPTERWARTKLDGLVWAGLGSTPAIEHLRAYLDEFPKGANAGAAQARIAALEREAAEARAAEQQRAQETAEWGAVAASTDMGAIEAFLKRWPNGQHAGGGAGAHRRVAAWHRRTAPRHSARGGRDCRRRVVVGGRPSGGRAAMASSQPTKPASSENSDAAGKAQADAEAAQRKKAQEAAAEKARREKAAAEKAAAEKAAAEKARGREGSGCRATRPGSLRAARLRPELPRSAGEWTAVPYVPRDGGGAERQVHDGLARQRARARRVTRSKYRSRSPSRSRSASSPLRAASSRPSSRKPGTRRTAAATGAAGGAADKSWRAPGFAQDDRHPVVCVNWNDAKAYAEWLSSKTGKTYRLLSEAEREYVTRAGTTTPFWWGTSITPQQANYNGNFLYAGGGSKGEYRQRTVPVDSFEPNPWGLYNVHGNVWEWTEDCWNASNSGNPGNGSARTTGDCRLRVRSRRFLGRPSTEPPLRQPQQVHHRPPDQQYRFPGREDAYTLNLYLFTSWVQGEALVEFFEGWFR